MHILHLLDPAHCGDEGLLACHHLAQSVHDPADLLPPPRHECWLIGSHDDERRAWSFCIPTADRIHPRRFDGARVGLTRLLRARNINPDIVHCWSLPTLLLARAAFGDDDSAPMRIAIFPNVPAGLEPGYASAIDGGERAREIVCTLDEPARQSLAPILGVSLIENRWAPPLRLLEPPAFKPGGPLPTDREALRAALGLTPADSVVAALADPPDSLDAMNAAFAGGVLNAIGHRTVFLLRRGGHHERRGAAYTRAHGRRWGSILADLSLHELLAAADIAVVDHAHGSRGLPACGPIAINLAISMGIPIASAPGLFTALRASSGQAWPIRIGNSAASGRIAVPLADLLGNPALRIQLAAEARTFADTARARNGFRTGIARLWEETRTGQYTLEPATVE